MPHKSEATILGELEISSDLPEEFTKQASYYAYWAFEYARANDAFRKSEENVDAVFSDLYAEFREENPDSKENDCKSYIRSHPDHKAALTRRRKSEYNLLIMKAALRAFEMRASMLSQLGAQFRAEKDQVGMGGAPPNSAEKRKKRKKASKVVQDAFQRRK